MLGTSNWKLATFYPLFWRKVQSVFMPAIITLDPQAPKGQLMFVMTLNCVVVARRTHSNSNSNWRTCNMQQHCGRLPAIRLGIFSIGEYPPFLLFYIFSPVVVVAAENCNSWLAAIKRQQQYSFCGQAS